MFLHYQASSAKHYIYHNNQMIVQCFEGIETILGYDGFNSIMKYLKNEKTNQRWTKFDTYDPYINSE